MTKPGIAFCSFVGYPEALLLSLSFCCKNTKNSPHSVT